MCSIAPDGSIYPCESLTNYDKFIYGNIHDGIENIFFSDKKRINFINRVNNITECYNCELFNICFGGCPSNAYKINRDINSKDPFCEAYLEIFRYIKNKIYQNNT